MKPTLTHADTTPPRRMMSRLWRQLSPRRRRQFFMVLGLMLIGAVAEVVSLGAVLPFLAVLADPVKLTSNPRFQPWSGYLAALGGGNLLVAFTLLFAVAAIGAGAVRILLNWASNRYVFLLGHDLGTRVYERVLHQPYSWHVSRNTSEIIGAIQKVQAVTNGMLMPLMQGFSSAFIGLFIVAALVFVSPVISLVAFVSFGLLYLAVSLFTRRTLRANSKVMARAQSERIRAVQEGLGGIRDVLLDGSQGEFLKRFRRLDSEFREAQATSTLIGSSPRYVIEAFGMVLIAGLALYLGTGEGGLVAAIPVLGALALGAQRLMPLMQIVYNGWTRVASSAHSLEDVLEILEAPAQGQRLAPPPLPFEHAITFRNVSFAYGAGEAPVLRHVDLTIPKGARVGIVGKTGSGKSTLVDLLMGLLEPSSGSIEVDGVPLTAETRRSWQRQIAHVPQAIFLSDASLAENIAFGIPPAAIDQTRVHEAAGQAQIANFIVGLPDGYKTTVGERGVRLSGGQRQRIGIARALYKEAQVLVLDEATSALDGGTEEVVMRSLQSIAQTITVVMIAHRHSTLNDCELIVEVNGPDKLAVLESNRLGSSYFSPSEMV